MKDKTVKKKNDKRPNTSNQGDEATDENAPRPRKNPSKVKTAEKTVKPNREDMAKENITKEKEKIMQPDEKRRTDGKKEKGKILKAVVRTNQKSTRNLGWVNRSCVNDQAVKNRIQDLLSSRLIHANQQVEWLARSIQCIDLTTLAGDDCPSNVARLCSKAAHPLGDNLTKALQIKHGLLTTGAVCVYPARVADACLGLERLGADIPVASVATGFPTGQTSLKIRLEEIEFAVANGAKEIDIVINRELALSQNWEELYNELVEMRKVCGESHMKSILAVGELCNLTNIYKASLVAMMAGSDFIKTSTGKETVNATLPIGLVMCRAIRAYNRKTGFKVGFKPAGGIRTSKDVLQWMTLMKEELGNDYLTPELFRIGASALLNDIERNLANYATGGYFMAEEMPMA
uniref:deoxyribose-phosphate aldolase n=1 Tax=Daphnia lumholtzi TaxID=42856 RepID=A0A4Y7MC40_9CRUS|nr:EOG090X08W6 [Daphnia lumholtzi]